MDVLFILDASGSIGQQNFDTIKQWLILIVRQLDIDGGRVRIAVETFSDNVRQEFSLNTHRTRLGVISAIEIIQLVAYHYIIVLNYFQPASVHLIECYILIYES